MALVKSLIASDIGLKSLWPFDSVQFSQASYLGPPNMNFMDYNKENDSDK